MQFELAAALLQRVSNVQRRLDENALELLFTCLRKS